MNTKKERTLLEALVQLFPESSKNTLRQWIEQGRVLVDDAVIEDARTPVSVQNTIQLQRKSIRGEGNVKILFEDAALVVIHKPSGLLSVATNFEKTKTAHAILKRRYPRKKVFVIHRLDQETSGVMLFALTHEAYVFLKKELAARHMKRLYEAVVEGRFEDKKGSWTSYLEEDAAYHVHVSKDPKRGERAVTHYEVLRAGNRFSYVAFQLETGKKNQIRVQAQEAGHPVTGDAKYGAQHNPFKRLALHACRLEFCHPTTKKKCVFEDPAPSAWKKIG